METNDMSYVGAVQDFRVARRRAAMERIMADLKGRSADLLSFEEVRQKLKVGAGRRVFFKEIPLDAIVGSVGRYTDFTRSFLPRLDSDAHRWARVQKAVTDLRGLPPIEVYQIGQVYFVQDGNHRVSVARQLGSTYIEAYVTEVQTRVPLSPDVQPDDLILKAEYAEFLENTDLDLLRPDADLTVTSPGRYRLLEEHIKVHRHFMGLEQEREIPFGEAVGHWYDQVYMPVVQVIREQGILHDFPERTETDLYLWVSEHRSDLEEALGWNIEIGDAAADLAARFGSRSQGLVSRLGERILDAVSADGMDDDLPPEQRRSEPSVARLEDRLFADILVPVSGEQVGWHALDQALEVARHEGVGLRGLHVVPSEAQKESDDARAIQEEFERRCQVAGISGSLIVEAGKVTRSITDRASWNDLVVVNLAYPPAPQPVAKLSSGFRSLIRHCPRPILAAPRTCSPLSKALLAYDGSPKAKEALFVATYVAGRWHIPLDVVSVSEGSRVAPTVLEEVQKYLEAHAVPATLLPESGPVADVILDTAEAQSCDLILIGGYGHSPVIEVVLGSVVDQVLRSSQWPVLICS